MDTVLPVTPRPLPFLLQLTSYPPRRKQRTESKHFPLFLFIFLHSQNLILTWSNSLSPLIEEKKELTSLYWGQGEESKGGSIPIRLCYQFYLWLHVFFSKYNLFPYFKIVYSTKYIECVICATHCVLCNTEWK